MIMADILKIFLLTLGILIVYVSYWLLSEALFPKFVERASRFYLKPVKISLLGLVVAIVPMLMGAQMANLPNPLLKIIGITLLVLPGLLGLVGSAGLTLRIGLGLPSPLDAEQPWRRVLRGGVLLAFSFLLPVIGWVVIPVWVLASGLGAFILSLREQSHERRMQAPPAPAEFAPVHEAMG